MVGGHIINRGWVAITVNIERTKEDLFYVAYSKSLSRAAPLDVSVVDLSSEDLIGAPRLTWRTNDNVQPTAQVLDCIFLRAVQWHLRGVE